MAKRQKAELIKYSRHIILNNNSIENSNHMLFNNDNNS